MNSITSITPITPDKTMTTLITSSFSITRLPDLCLIHVFQWLPLTDLLHINAVCRRFAEVQSATLLKRTSLSIVDHKMATFYLDTLDFYQVSEHASFDRLVVQYEFTSPLKATGYDPEKIHTKFIIFNARACNALIERLPNITHLKLISYAKSVLVDAHAVEMLCAWAPRLTHLTMYGISEWDNVAPAINNLPSLKYLSAWVGVARLAKLTISTQLSEFYVKYARNWDVKAGDWDQPEDLQTTLKNLVEGSKIVKFGLYLPYKESSSTFYLGEGSQNLQPPTSIVQKLTRLSVKLDRFEHLEKLTTTFRFLKYLHLEFTILNSTASQTPPLEAILTHLSRLPYLTSLSLDILDRFNRSEKSSVLISELTSEGQNSQNSVLWVKEIKLLFPLHPHQLPALERLLPNVQSASFRVLSCDDLTTGSGRGRRLLCSDERCSNCGHVEAVMGQYRELIERKIINSFVLDFTFKFGKIIAHSVRFG